MTKSMLAAVTLALTVWSCGGNSSASTPDAAPSDGGPGGLDAPALDTPPPGSDASDAVNGLDEGSMPIDGAGTTDTDNRPRPRTWVREMSLLGRAVGGTGPNDVWIVGDSGRAWNSTGDGQWTARRAETDWKLTGVWGSAPNDVYVSVEANLVLHWNGQGWEKQFDGIPIGAVFGTVWGTGPKDIYLAGPNLYRSMGDGKWVAQRFSGVAPFVDLWASGPMDIWALGSAGVLRSRGDGVWRAEQTGQNIAVQAIWGSGPNDVYALYGGSVLHTRGDGLWRVQDIPERRPDVDALNDIWGSGPDDVYIIGNARRMFRSRGDGRWFAEDIPITSAISIWGTGPDNIYLLGFGGAVMRSR